MTKRVHVPMLVTLVIAAALAGAYMIVTAHPSAGTPGGMPPAGVLH